MHVRILPKTKMMNRNFYRPIDKKTVILDGTRPHDKDLDSILALLTDVLHKHKGGKVQTFRLRDIKLNRCVNCFNCWIKTPGRCFHIDEGAEILQAILNSNTVILFTPVVFGGYSSELKRIIDRFLPLLLPFFKKSQGETHHPPRYSNLLHFIGIGVHPHPTEELSECFKILVGRNALNLPPSCFAAEVISSENSAKTLRDRFQSLFAKTDRPPRREDLFSLANDTVSAPKITIENRRALLVVGSQKSRNSGTSGILGEYLLKRLKKYGWKTESLSTKAILTDKKQQYDFCSSVDRADTVILSFPLFFDTLPFSLIKALEIVAASRRTTAPIDKPKNLLVLVNNGFPEPHQNSVAIAVCRNFALECGMTWAGGLALGTGELLISGHSLTGFKGCNGFRRPPLYYVIQALNIAASSLAEGYPVPEKAVRLIARRPVPCISFALWRWFLIKMVNWSWKKEALKNGITKETMYSAPYSNNE